MLVTRIGLTDFRNYSTVDLELTSGATLFLGSNGQGKTNLVEAINYLSTLSSHRVSTDQALIRQGRDFAVIRASVKASDRQALIEIQINRSGSNRAKLNRNEVRMREVPRYASSILFAPEDLSLVRGEPAARRRFMDELLVLVNPRFVSIFADYDRVLRQRNSLLKSSRGSVPVGADSTLEVWDEKLVDLGSQIIIARNNLIDELQPEVRNGYLAIAGSEHSVNLRSQLSLLSKTEDLEDAGGSLDSKIDPEELRKTFLAKLQATRRQELERGVSLIGPHRDDLLIELNGMPARGYSSHGESWSLALALRIASARHVKSKSLIGDPILILDDVFAELDQSRRTRLSDAISDFEQILITAAVAEDVPQGLVSRTIQVQNGQIVTESEVSEHR